MRPAQSRSEVGTEPQTAASASRSLVRTALKGALGTIERETGHPYASLILLATEPTGSPLFLISRLALHTRNLERDPRASILFDGTGGRGDPLTGARVTLQGIARPSASPIALRRFLARHPSAEAYAGFADFSMYELQVTRGHYIGGFGRIVDLPATAVTSEIGDAQPLIEAESDIIAHMNADHADAVVLYATELAGRQPGKWRVAGIDPWGIDLLHCTNAARIDFAERVRNPAEARKILVALVQLARERAAARK
jgi:heme iron utilization protein